MCTMLPPPRSRMAGTTVLVSTNAPTRLIRSTSAKSAALISVSGARSLTAAELISASTPPSSARVVSTRRCASASIPTSPATASALPPTFVIASTTSASGSGRRPKTTTRAPSAANSSAVARPMPVPPPVTMATLPSSPPIVPPFVRVAGAQAFHRAARTLRGARGAPRGAEVHECLIVVIRAVFGKQRSGEIPHGFVTTEPAKTPATEEDASEHPTHVGVDERSCAAISKRADGAGGVRPDPRHAPQLYIVIGQSAAVAGQRLTRDALEAHRPDVVAERIPRPPDVDGTSPRQTLERRVPKEKLVILRYDPIDLGLLQHDLGHEDVIGIIGPSPRQITSMSRIPPQ